MTDSDYERYREAEREARRAYQQAREEAKRARVEARRARDAARRAAGRSNRDDLKIDLTLDLDLSDLSDLSQLSELSELGKHFSRSDKYKYKYKYKGNFPRRVRRRGLVLGVCRDIADYLGIETWIVRVLMITGLIFMPTFVLPAYIVGGLGMRIWLSHRARQAVRAEETDERLSATANGADRNAAEPGVADLLRRAAARMGRAEQRLRDMEAYVTSGRYDLQRELNELDGKGARP